MFGDRAASTILTMTSESLSMSRNLFLNRFIQVSSEIHVDQDETVRLLRIIIFLLQQFSNVLPSGNTFNITCQEASLKHPPKLQFATVCREFWATFSGEHFIHTEHWPGLFDLAVVLSAKH